jgi:nucleotide-binding universal stress UspA family protein
MLQNLLVPLDGSALAEKAMPVAVCLAQSLGAKITLLHVIERNAPKAIHHERHLTEAQEAERYLDEVAAKLPPGLKVEKHVHTEEVKDVARSIAEHGGELAPDLIVMCTHGRGGPKRWAFGSNAEQVVALGTTPTLLIPAESRQEEKGFADGLLLVPLDAAKLHEAALPLAMELAKGCKAKLRLLSVVNTISQLTGAEAASAAVLPATMAALLDMEGQAAGAYLRPVLAKVQAEGVLADATVLRGQPAPTIMKAARDWNADMIVLATHGKTGTNAFWSGSIAPRVVLRADLPVLLVPIK